MHLGKIILPLLTTTLLMSGSAKSIYQSKCASCHGKHAEKKALGKSKVIRGMSTDTFIKRMKAFASGEQHTLPIAKIVKKQFIDRYDAKEIKAVAEYVKAL